MFNQSVELTAASLGRSSPFAFFMVVDVSPLLGLKAAVAHLSRWTGTTRSMVQRLQHAFLRVACGALLVGIAGCSPTDTKRMQALLDQISHGPEDQLGTFIY